MVDGDQESIKNEAELRFKVVSLPPQDGRQVFSCLFVCTSSLSRPQTHSQLTSRILPSPCEQAKCYVALKEYKSAQSELETVPGSHRTLQARLMLAKLYLQTGRVSALIARALPRRLCGQPTARWRGKPVISAR